MVMAKWIIILFLLKDYASLLEDQDKDGVADIKKIMLSGFALSNPQHNLNTPLYGLDNWIYLAHEPAVTSKIYDEEFGDKGREIVFTNNLTPPELLLQH